MDDVIHNPAAWMGGGSDGDAKPHVVVLLDESGSMAPHQLEVINSFNDYVESVKEVAATVSLYTFDSRGVREIFRGEPPAFAPKLTAELYRPHAATPLYDAMGDVIARVRARAGSNKVQFVTHTDGMENASREWTKAALDALIEKLTADGWLFVYLGENLEGAAAVAVFQGMKLNMAAGQARTNSMDFMTHATRQYQGSGAVNPEAYTGSGDTLDFTEGEEGK